MIPHFDLPFRFNNGHAVVVDQNSLDDISNCVEAILLTRQGDRLEMPDFGIPDPTFQNQPIDLQPILQSISDQEPRATVLFEQKPDLLDSLIDRVTSSVSKQEVQGV